MIGSLAGCVRNSNGTWIVSEAAVPDGWPELTPVNEIQIKQYPSYRSAKINAPVSGTGNQGSLFRQLFNHIQESEISMTAPVEMSYQSDGDSLEMASMAFLYRNEEAGPSGIYENLTVADAQPNLMLSIGVRGSYADKQMKPKIESLDNWIEQNAVLWEQTGPPRYLGYNSPFVPAFMRYGEIQIPVRKRDLPSQQMANSR
jgi:hypothetical protein